MSDIKTTEPDFAKVNLVNPREVEDSEAFRKRQARAAWKIRQERKRQRNAHAECEARAPMKPNGLAETISGAWKRIKGTFA